MSRLPVRVRITLAFAGVMAVVLSGIGFAVYLRFEAQLDQTIEQGLRSRADDVRAVLAQESRLRPPGAGRGGLLVEQGESFAQILALDGSVLDATVKLGSRPLLSSAQHARAARGTIVIDRESPFERGEPSRLLATPIATARGRIVAVVGTATDDRRDALRTLALLLALGGAAALALASVAGSRVAAAALRPVEAMRAKADEISSHARGERLPIAPGDDEIARLGATLNAMLTRLEASFEREQSFVADAGHELRTPLAILKSEIELALRDGRSHEDLISALRSAAEETDRLTELAEALLVIARSDGGKLPLTTTELQAADLLAGVGARFGTRVRASNRRIVVDAPESVTLNADPRRIAQALDNLVDNALRHGAGTIHVSARAQDGRVELHVRDAGPGFPADFIADAFDRFARADPARARGGSGLGLSIVRVIARAHGGEARAANQPSGGADVSIELPAGG